MNAVSRSNCASKRTSAKGSKLFSPGSSKMKQAVRSRRMLVRIFMSSFGPSAPWPASSSRRRETCSASYLETTLPTTTDRDSKARRRVAVYSADQDGVLSMGREEMVPGEQRHMGVGVDWPTLHGVFDIDDDNLMTFAAKRVFDRAADAGSASRYYV